jgi:hypothetical protein
LENRKGRSKVLRDPGFTENRDAPVHRWIPWIAGFSGQFVSDVISRYAREDYGVVCDPFAGVGTTLVESKMHGLDAVGVEINPYAALASRVKLDWNIDIPLFEGQLKRLADLLRYVEQPTSRGRLEAYSEISSSGKALLLEPRTSAPAGFKTREPFFDPQTERKVLLLKEFAIDTPDSLRDLFKAALGAILVKYSQYAYGPSLGRKSLMKIRQPKNGEVGIGYQKKLAEILQDLKWIQSTVKPKLKREPQHRVILGNVFHAMNEIPNREVGLLVTSPPYLNNYHYPRNTRPQLYWLDFVSKPDDLRNLEQDNFGKFWQTVRESEPIDLNFRLDGLEAIIHKISKRNPQKGIYGGRGWANYVTVYFNDIQKFFESFQDKMKRKSTMVWVLGNSVIQGVEVNTDKFVGRLAELADFKLEHIDKLRTKRVGSSIVNTNIRTKSSKPTELYDAAVIIKKR